MDIFVNTENVMLFFSVLCFLSLPLSFRSQPFYIWLLTALSVCFFFHPPPSSLSHSLPTIYVLFRLSLFICISLFVLPVWVFPSFPSLSLSPVLPPIFFLPPLPAGRGRRKLVDCPQLLDVDDMVKMREPDWKCVYTYLQEFYRGLVTKGLVKTKNSS